MKEEVLRLLYSLCLSQEGLLMICCGTDSSPKGFSAQAILRMLENLIEQAYVTIPTVINNCTPSITSVKKA